MKENYRRLTHSHVIGGIRTGKSKFLEYLMREDASEWRPFALIDWHGTLYRDVLSYFAHYWAEREIIVFNFADPRFVTPLPFFSSHGPDISTTVSRNLSALLKPWGGSLNEMPTLERVGKILLTFAAESGETLPNASRILNLHDHEVREYAMRHLSDPYLQRQLAVMNSAKTLKEWEGHTLSLQNRLGRFLTSQTVKRFVGLKSTFNLQEAVERGAIILLNLGHSPYLSRESAKVFASLFLSEFFEIAMQRAGTDELYTLYLDEFQAYATDSIGQMLDQVLKGGLHLVLAHQHLAQGLDPHLKESILTNARMRVAFGGLSFDTASELVNEMLLDEVNRRQVMHQRTQTREIHVPAWDDIWSTTEHEGPEGKSTSSTSTFRPGFRIHQVEETYEETWSREEKVSRAAQRLINQPQRRCLAKYNIDPAISVETPLLEDYGHSAEYVAQYEEWLSEKQGAFPADVADRKLAESEKEFTERVTPKDEPSGTNKRAKTHK